MRMYRQTETSETDDRATAAPMDENVLSNKPADHKAQNTQTKLCQQQTLQYDEQFRTSRTGHRARSGRQKTVVHCPYKFNNNLDKYTREATGCQTRACPCLELNPSASSIPCPPRKPLMVVDTGRVGARTRFSFFDSTRQFSLLRWIAPSIVLDNALRTDTKTHSLSVENTHKQQTTPTQEQREQS